MLKIIIIKMLRFSSQKAYKQYLSENPDYLKDYKDLYYSNIIIANSIKVGGKWHHPYVPGYETVVVLMKSTSKWGEIGPYTLRTKEGIIFENYWQFSKVYPDTPNAHIMEYGRSLWKYDKTNFITDGEVNNAYWEWRYKGYKAERAIRYPIYKKNASKCLYAIPEFDKTKKLGYVEARREIYFKKYIESIVDHRLYKQLKKMLADGKKIILSEIDGIKHYNSGYHKEKYEDLVAEPLEFGTINVTKNNLHIMVNDTHGAIGHVYPLAIALKGWNVDEIFECKEKN